MEVTDATGGSSYWQGMGNPVSLDPFFIDLRKRLLNQFALTFTSPLKGKAEMESLKVQGELHGKVTAPREVWVGPAGAE